MKSRVRTYLHLKPLLRVALLLGACGVACQSRAVGIVYVGDDAGVDASTGGSAEAGSGGDAGTGNGGLGGGGNGSGGSRDAGPDAEAGSGASDAGSDAKTDVDVPDADIPDGDVPPTKHCEPAADWAEDLATAEIELFDAINEQRDLGAICDGTTYRPAPSLILRPILRCSARLHTKDMVDRDFFSLFNPDGEDPQDRMRAAGWPHPTWGENIFHDNDSPTAVVAQWIAAGGDQCRNIVDSHRGSIGVGRFGNKWTIDLGVLDAGLPTDAGSDGQP